MSLHEILFCVSRCNVLYELVFTLFFSILIRLPATGKLAESYNSVPVLLYTNCILMFFFFLLYMVPDK